MADERTAVAPATPSTVTQRAAAAAAPSVKWDDANMRSSYANVCNVASTREEVVLLFGINQAWHAGQKEVTVQLTDRIILSPFAAKRLALLLGNLLREHESRFGPLPIDGRAGDGASS
jgi:hypothetical protein